MTEKTDTNPELTTEQTSVCCDILEKMNIDWMKDEDGNKIMPFIYSNSDETMYRVNFCPSCGKNVRSIVLST